VPTEITGSQKRQLRGLAQKLEPLLKIGKNGLSQAFIKSASETLDLHELVKVRFTEFKDERKELAKQLAEKTDAHLIAIVGHVAVFYRQNSDVEKRKIRLK
tara:strand:+ start:262 stop:564 length:303 start_codon:yes stop_codon:yes gene_type:complete